MAADMAAGRADGSGGVPQKTEKAAFAAGCFWGVEAAFRQVPGVVNVTSGYMGGTLPDPTYKDVCSDTTGHAEAVLVEYDPRVVQYGTLVDFFFSIHDPTTPNRQGPDVGTQYRSAIFCYTPEQEEAARLAKENLRSAGTYQDPVVTEIVRAPAFYPAEEYHQRYFEKQGIRPQCHVPRRE